MDMRHQDQDGSNSSWTDEKHMQFLDSVEASFVRSMLEGGNNGSGGHLPRLDRYMPDSSESTRDLKSQRRKKLHPTAGINGGADKKPRGHSSQPSDSSYDQVVPQLMNNKAADHKG